MSVTAFIDNLSDEQQKMVRFFDEWFVDDLKLTSKIRYKIPFYYLNSWICYINPVKENKIELAFLRGNELSNHQKILDFRDRKQVAGIVYENVKEIDKKIINEVIQEAIWLDQTKKYASKRKK
ncbi:MAG: DUF1801 domain-containing protein [Chitinophagales bacterium]